MRTLGPIVHRAQVPPQDEIPACLCIDVEPDRLQVPPVGPAPWVGYSTMLDRMERLRSRLEDATGFTPSFAWFFRMDPQVRRLHGRADFAVDALADRVAALQAHGDTFGIHVHPLRWCDRRSLWFHDFADAAWLRHCVESSFEAYAGAFGDPPLRHRFGTRFLSNELVALLEDLGIGVDLTIEPGLGASIFAPPSVPMTGTLPDYRRVPRNPYRPAPNDFRRADTRNGRNLVMMPISSTRLRLDKPLWWQTARMIRRGSRGRSLPLHPWRDWQSPELYWELASRKVTSMRQPYLAFAVRTDPPSSESAARAWQALDLLPAHPLAQRLRFVDPLAIAARMSPAR